ncbi:MAG: hypothetical protein H6862_00465 [Rhodospirillales bacterium]|nr:hypothetical protein [Rhodospirillales bacterium]
MSNIVRAPFGAAVALVGALTAVSGCDSDSPYDAPKSPPISKSPTGFSVTPIQEGDFFSALSNGAYRLDVPAEAFGGKPGTIIPCLAMKESYPYRGYAGLSCDWSVLHPKTPDGPQ